MYSRPTTCVCGGAIEVLGDDDGYLARCADECGAAVGAGDCVSAALVDFAAGQPAPAAAVALDHYAALCARALAAAEYAPAELVALAPLAEFMLRYQELETPNTIPSPIPAPNTDSP